MQTTATMTRHPLEMVLDHIDAHRDTYRDELLALIEQKAQGREVVHPPAPEPVAEVVDLVDALETSLQRAEQRRASA